MWECPRALRPLQGLFFNFTASKYVLIKDWRLGVLLRCLQIGILIYVLRDIFKKASYLTTEVPTGFVTVWPEEKIIAERTAEFEDHYEALKNGSLNYCENPEEYNFNWGGVNHTDYECAFLDSPFLFVNGESQMFVMTSLRIEKRLFKARNEAKGCDPSSMLGRKYEELKNPFEGACSYTAAEGYFPILPEDIKLNLIHSYRTSSVINKKGSMPRTIIRAPGYTNQHKDYEAGTTLSVTLSELLTLVGIDLDKRLNEQDNTPSEDETQGSKKNQNDTETIYPYARLSGMTLHVTFNYYTRRVAPKEYQIETGSHADDIICLVDIFPQNKWSFLGSDIREAILKPSDPALITDRVLEDLLKDDVYNASEIVLFQTDFQRNGITIIISVSGSVGRFDIAALINALVAGSVLLAVAQSITTYVALFALGLSSELYKAFMRETVDWRQEYARYATQACVAGYAFLKYDTNKSMKLDRNEIFEVLKNLMKKQRGMEDWQLAALADFIMRQGEKSELVQKGRFSKREKRVENYIDIVEWIDIFTEDKANWPALRRLIEHEYNDDESKEEVMTLLHRSQQRSRGLDISIPGLNDSDEEIERDGTPHPSMRGSIDFDEASLSPLIEEKEKGRKGRWGRRGNRKSR